MLGPVQDKSQSGSQDIVWLHEAFNSDGSAVITIVASVKPWCHEWRVYWMAFSAGMPEHDRLYTCLTRGNKLDADVARAMFPDVEREFDVRWRA